MKKQPKTLLERDRELAARGVPICPRCGERDKVVLQLSQWWCDRCFGFLVTLEPRPGRHTPDF